MHSQKRRSAKPLNLRDLKRLQFCLFIASSGENWKKWRENMIGNGRLELESHGDAITKGPIDVITDEVVVSVTGRTVQ